MLQLDFYASTAARNNRFRPADQVWGRGNVTKYEAQHHFSLFSQLRACLGVFLASWPCWIDDLGLVFSLQLSDSNPLLGAGG